MFLLSSSLAKNIVNQSSLKNSFSIGKSCLVLYVTFLWYGSLNPCFLVIPSKIAISGIFAWNISLLDEVLEIAIIFFLFSKRYFKAIRFSKLSRNVIKAYSSMFSSSNKSLNSSLKLNEDRFNSLDCISDSSFSLT